MILSNNIIVYLLSDHKLYFSNSDYTIHHLHNNNIVQLQLLQKYNSCRQMRSSCTTHRRYNSKYACMAKHMHTCNARKRNHIQTCKKHTSMEGTDTYTHTHIVHRTLHQAHTCTSFIYIFIRSTCTQS